MDEIVRLHGVPLSSLSDRDARLTARFWDAFPQAMGSKVNLSTAFHPQTDRQSERTIQILEDILLACVLSFPGSWDLYLPLMGFAYNNNFQASLGMASFEALYGRRCISPICWEEAGERPPYLFPLFPVGDFHSEIRGGILT